MDIFKLFFDHDLRLDKLAKRNANKTQEEKEASLEDFMKPTPTYSKFYITGTRLRKEIFGINTLEKWKEILSAFDEAFNAYRFHCKGEVYDNAGDALSQADVGDAIIISEKEVLDGDLPFSSLGIDRDSNVGHFKEELSEVLLEAHLVLYKEQAHNGFDLHLFSKENIYPLLFKAFKPLVGPDFRFFSINSKRMGSERHLYFETWTLDKPPHGAEEVLPQTVL